MAKGVTLFWGRAVVTQKERVLEQILNTRDPTTMVIVPTRRWARKLREQWWQQEPRMLLSYPPIYSIEEFWQRLSYLVPEPQAQLQGWQQLAFISLLLTHASRQKNARRLQLAAPQFLPSVSLQLLKFISVLQESSMSPSQLKTRVQRADTPDGLKAAIAFWSLYEKKLHSLSLADSMGTRRFTLEMLSREGFTRAFPAIERVRFVGFDFFSQLFLQLIQSLSTCMVVEVFLPYEEGREKIFGHMTTSFSRLQQLADEVVKKEQTLEGWQSFLNYTISSPSHELQQVKIIKAPNRQREVHGVAKYVKRLLLQGSVQSYRHLAICVPQLDRYLPLIEETFNDYRIPFEVTAGQPLAGSPVVNLVLNLLELVKENYHRFFLLRCMRSPYMKKLLGDWVFDRRLFDHVCQQHFVVEGREEITQAIEQELEFANGQIEKGERFDELEEKLDVETLMLQRKKLADLWNILNWLGERLRPLEETQALEQLLGELEQIIANLRLAEAIASLQDNGAPLSWLEGELEALKVLMETVRATRRLAAKFQLDEQVVEDLLQLIRLLISQRHYRSRRPEQDAVMIMGKLEPRGLGLDYLFMVGMVEGEFPIPSHPPVFLSPHLLDEWGINHTYTPGRAVDTFLFYVFALETRSELVLSYPEFEEERPLTPSLVVEEMKRLGAEELATDDTIMGTREAMIALAKTSAAQALEQLLGEQKSVFLRRGTRALEMRKNVDEWTSYEGTIKSPELQQKLARRLAVAKFSATQFEQYAKCPFQYFCERLLGVEVEEPFREDISPLRRGLLIHTILFKFLTQVQQRDIPLSAGYEQELHALLGEVAEQEWSRLAGRGILWEIEKEKLLGSNTRAGVLGRFLALELKDIPQSGFLPSFFELAFGRSGPEGTQDARSLPRPFTLEEGGDRLLLSGKIDRIDAGSNHTFFVTDYKTGSSVPFGPDIFRGLSLQLPVYLMAAEQVLTRLWKTQARGLGASFYLLHHESKVRKTFHFWRQGGGLDDKWLGRRKPQVVLDDALTQARAHLMRYFRRMKRGEFPPSPHPHKGKDLCNSCHYQHVCRLNWQKVMRMAAGEEHDA